ncbi:MAG: TetR/AcrR family transcriptional regulator [Cloacibacillus sp.]
MYIKGTKRQQQAKETKKRIFEVAHQMFREKGFNNVTVEEIADATGISVGTLYHHFKNKFAILVAWHEQLDEKYAVHLEEVLASSEPRQNILDVIKEMMLYMDETCVYYGSDYIGVVYSYMISSDEFAKIMTNRDRTYYKIITQLVRMGQESGEIRPDIPEKQLIKDLTIISRGCLMDWVIERSTQDIRSHNTSAFDCYLRGIAGDTKKITKAS